MPRIVPNGGQCSHSEATQPQFSKRIVTYAMQSDWKNGSRERGPLKHRGYCKVIFAVLGDSVASVAEKHSLVD